MTTRKRTKGQRSTKHTHKTKDRVTRTSLKTGGEFRCSGRVSSSCSTSATPCYSRTAPKSKRQCVETELKSIPLTYIHMTDNFPGLVQEPLIQDNGVKLDYE